MMLEIELDKEDQLFALPPFVNIVREVTGDERYSNSNIAEPLVLQTQTS
jgi:CYTH domain-containing protein